MNKNILLENSLYYGAILASISSFVPISFVSRGSGGGSLFDLLMPVFLLFFVAKYLSALKPRVGSSFAYMALILAAIAVFTKIDANNPIIAFGIFARIVLVIFYLVFAIYYLPPMISNKNLKGFSDNIVYPTCIFYILTCASSFLFYLTGSWRTGFPFYSNGLDPHVWGPSVMASGILLLSSFLGFINIPKFSSPRSNNRFGQGFLLITSLTCIIMGFLSSSRGAFLIFVFMTLLIFPILSKSLYKLITKFLKSCLIPFVLICSVILSLFIVPALSNRLFDNELFQNIQLLSTRTLSVSTILQGSDSSRSSKLQSITDQVFNTNPLSRLFGKPDLVYKNDSGLLFYIDNFGYLSALLLISSLVYIWIGPYRSDNVLLAFSTAILIITLVGSESVFVPRFLLFPFPAFLLAKTLHLK